MAHTAKTRKKISESLKRYHSKRKKGSKLWMKDAVKRPGALRRKAKRLGLIKGDKKLTTTDINVLEHSRNPTTRKEAYLAATFGKYRKHKNSARKRITR